MTSTLKPFVKGVQAVLPKFELLGEALEACGLECYASTRKDLELGHEWHFSGATLRLSIIHSHCDVYAGLYVEDDEDLTRFKLEADNGPNWKVSYFAPINENSPIAKLREKIWALFPDASSGSNAIDLKDDSTAIEVVKLMAAAFKKA
ncbi:MAG: hypothetical protein WCT54_04920 [Patescibacteria group bacterium]|jgi:hypothetical protein